MSPLPVPQQPLPRGFYARDPATVARQLLGKALLRYSANGQLCGGVIVETEAYLASEDPASHSHRGPTRRNASMFAQPGTLYVYAIHAKYCLNAATERQGTGSAVLIRALEPVWGLAAMRHRRGQPAQDRQLTAGPAMLCQALEITLADDGTDLVQSTAIWMADIQSLPTFTVRATERIGISQAGHLPLRFLIDGNRFVSGRVSDHSRPRTGRLVPP